MSMNKNYYVIAGYDLTDWKTDKYEDWKWTDEGEEYSCNHSKGNIQLFYDPMSGSHLYLGFVLAAGDEWGFRTENFDIELVTCVKNLVTSELIKLIGLGVIRKDPKFNPKYQVYVFEECT